jgi:hypothetical protein
MPVIGILAVASPEDNAVRLRAFREGLKVAGYVEAAMYFVPSVSYAIRGHSRKTCEQEARHRGTRTTRRKGQ